MLKKLEQMFLDMQATLLLDMLGRGIESALINPSSLVPEPWQASGINQRLDISPYIDVLQDLLLRPTGSNLQGGTMCYLQQLTNSCLLCIGPENRFPFNMDLVVSCMPNPKLVMLVLLSRLQFGSSTIVWFCALGSTVENGFISRAIPQILAFHSI
nr:mediator of rna polymerase ii transcription subunit 16 [Quercus suber]